MEPSYQTAHCCDPEEHIMKLTVLLFKLSALFFLHACESNCNDSKVLQIFFRIEDDDEIERDLNRVSLPQQNRNCVVQ